MDDDVRELLERLRDHEDHDRYCDGCEYRLKMINAFLAPPTPAPALCETCGGKRQVVTFVIDGNAGYETTKDCPTCTPGAK